jgi:hypothetical protein
MVFATQRQLPMDHEPARDAGTLVGNAAHKLMYSQEYKLIVDVVRHKAYKLLNDSLPMENSQVTHGTLRAYAEIYKVLTNGKDLFDAAS